MSYWYTYYTYLAYLALILGMVQLVVAGVCQKNAPPTSHKKLILYPILSGLTLIMYFLTNSIVQEGNHIEVYNQPSDIINFALFKLLALGPWTMFYYLKKAQMGSESLSCCWKLFIIGMGASYALVILLFAFWNLAEWPGLYGSGRDL